MPRGADGRLLGAGPEDLTSPVLEAARLLAPATSVGKEVWNHKRVGGHLGDYSVWDYCTPPLQV